MAKPVLRLGFTDYFENLDAFFTDWLSHRFEVIRDDVNPEFLIFCDETFGTQNLSYDPSKVVKIFYTGENRRAWNYKAHVGITFDHYDTPTHYRLPLYVLDHWVMVNRLGMVDYTKEWPDISFEDEEKIIRRQEDIAAKTGFCCFISGNPGNPHRNEFFQKLNSYGQVHSYGPLFNNMGLLPRGPEAAKNKATVLPKYKFNLCFENGENPGYCTEKLFHALYMKTVPIYCGSSTASVDFNPLAFLSWHDYLDDDKLLGAIIEMDQDDKLYEKMYMEPAFGTSDTWGHEGSNLFNKFFDPERFLDWFEKNVYPMRRK